MNTQSINRLHYTMIHIFFWAAYCTGTGYTSSFLLSIGYDNGQVGIVIAAAAAAASLMQPALAGVIDRSGKRKLKPILTAVSVIAAVLSLLQLIMPGNLPVMGICYGSNIAMLQFIIPIMNSMSSCSRRGPLNYGFSRAIGSLSYAATSYLLGIFVTGSGMQILVWMRLISYAGFIICVLLYPVKTGEIITRNQEKDNGFFKRYPGFSTIMAGCILVYFAHSVMIYYNYQIIVSKGGDNTSLGIALAIAAILEIPVMFGFTWLLKVKKAGFWFKLSGFGFAAKAIAFLLVTNVTAYYFAQITQMFGWALICVASVQFVSSITSDRDSTRGQAYITLTYSAAIVLGSLIGGYIIQIAGVNIMLITAIICALAGAVLLCRGISKYEN